MLYDNTQDKKNPNQTTPPPQEKKQQQTNKKHGNITPIAIIYFKQHFKTNKIILHNHNQ